MNPHAGRTHRGGGLEVLQQGPDVREPTDSVDDHDHSNDHFALVYETDEELWEAVVPFVREGLERNEQCIYVVDERTEDRGEILGAFRERGVDVDSALDSGTLEFATVRDTYLGGESFDPDEAVSFYADTVADALGEYDGFRVVAGTSWIDEIPLETFMEYEGRVNGLFEETDAMAICHYDRSQLSEEVICNVIRTHPHMIYDGTVCHNFYYVPPERLFGPGERGNEADRMLGTLRDRSRAKTELTEYTRSLQRLNEITADPDRDFEAKLQALFELGCERFGLELGGLNRVDRAENRFQVEYLSRDHHYFEPGIELPLSETYCRAPSEVMDTASVSDATEEGFDDIAVYEECGAEAYLGTYIAIDGGADRTFAFLSTEPRETSFSEKDRTYLELMGQWIKYELEQRHNTDQLAALNRLNEIARDINRELAHQSTREEIETVVCERLAASDSYEFAWIGAVDEEDRTVVSATSADGRESPSGTPFGLDDAPTDAVVPSDELRVVRNVSELPRLEAGDGRGVTARATIPVAYEDRKYGVLNVYTARERPFDDDEREVLSQLGEIMGLAIAAVEREEELEYERERLEFVNRLIRHNLLNDLNAIRAHADILETYVDEESDDHLETIRGRIDDMTELITTLRSLMEIITDEDQEFESVDLGEVLRTELQQARDSFDDAHIELRGDVPDDDAVRANELLAEAIENVLRNAVEHNDADAPGVVVTVESDADTLAVDVADNGPGIPERLEDRIFEKGQKDFASPGTGFGLYLTREIVEGYGGSITVADNDPSGTVFTVTLPRARPTAENRSSGR